MDRPGLDFHDLNLRGVQNNEGLTIQGGNEIRDASDQPWFLTIQHSRIVGCKTVSCSAPVLQGRDLVGAIITLNRGTDPVAKIRIERVREIPFFFPEGLPNPDKLEAYVLAYSPVIQGHVFEFGNLCYNPRFDLEPTSVEVMQVNGVRKIVAKQGVPPSIVPRRWQLGEDVPWYVMQVVGTSDVQLPPSSWRDLELLGMEPEEALIYAGDRIDSDSKTMSFAAEPDWFNIGCAGHTVAKLHLTRNTIASASNTVPVTNYDRRQATLKLLTGDYCGTGRSFTVPGVPLQWRGHSDDARKDFFDDAVPITMEGWWTKDGATCLNEQRLATGNFPRDPVHYRDLATLRDDIDATCREAREARGLQGALPACVPPDQFDPDKAQGGDLARVSANVVHETCVRFDELLTSPLLPPPPPPPWPALVSPPLVSFDAIATDGWDIARRYFVKTTIEPALHPTGSGVAFPQPKVRQIPFGTGVSLGMLGARVRFDLSRLPAPRRAVRFEFFDWPISRPFPGDDVSENIAIDGTPQDVVAEGDLSSGVFQLSDAYLSIQTTPVPATPSLPGGGTRGIVYLAPSKGITSLTIGGERLWIDNVCVLQ